MASIVVLAAHPELEHSRVNRALIDAAAALPDVQVRELYSLYPDYLIDVAAEQAALADARLVVWQHPIHWYHMPALMKLWVDDVLTFGWAYGPGGHALRGKDLWLVASTGGSAAAYRADVHDTLAPGRPLEMSVSAAAGARDAAAGRYPFEAFLPPYEQTATLCGMRFVAPLVLHGALRASVDTVAAHAQAYRARLQSYPDWPELARLPPCTMPDVPATDRPAAEPV